MVQGTIIISLNQSKGMYFRRIYPLDLLCCFFLTRVVHSFMCGVKSQQAMSLVKAILVFFFGGLVLWWQKNKSF